MAAAGPADLVRQKVVFPVGKTIAELFIDQAHEKRLAQLPGRFGMILTTARVSDLHITPSTPSED